MRARHRARSLWGGGAARALATRARRASQVGIGLPSLEGRHASYSALSFGARLWCHAPALASHGRLAHVRKRAATALALCLRRWGSPPHSKRSPHKRRGLSRSVQDSGATRRPWPRVRPACLRVRAHASAPPRSLSVGRRRSARACHARAPRLAGWNFPSVSRRPPR